MTTQGKRLRAVRIGLGKCKRSEFARLIGVTRQEIYKSERGERAVPLTMALKMKERLGVSLDWIYTGDTSSMSPDALTAIADAMAQIDDGDD